MGGNNFIVVVKVKEQGDLVRQLKADKASKEVNKEPILKILANS